MVVVQGRLHGAHRGLDAMHTGADPAQVCQRGHQANGAVAAHSQVAGVVEENHPGTGTRVHRLAQQCAHQYVAAPWFQHAGGAPLIVVLGQSLATFGHTAAAQVRETGGHQAGGFAAGVGVDHGNAFHGWATSVQMSERKSGLSRGAPA
ncbi:hypothetical protein D3C80_1520710 [compost metagenome]